MRFSIAPLAIVIVSVMLLVTCKPLKKLDSRASGIQSMADVAVSLEAAESKWLAIQETLGDNLETLSDTGLFQVSIKAKYLVIAASAAQREFSEKIAETNLQISKSLSKKSLDKGYNVKRLVMSRIMPIYNKLSAESVFLS